MDDDDLDALAAEYVLGTLPSDERAHAEALTVIDPGFVEIVRQWERRLGELNVMVEAVEPPKELWDKIKTDIATVAPGEPVLLTPAEPMPPTDAARPETAIESKAKSEQSAMLGALAASLTLPEGEAEAAAKAKQAEAEARTATISELAGKSAAGVAPQPPAASPLLPPSPPRPQIERGAEVFYLARRVRRWRRIAAVSGALAAVLAALIVTSQVDPGLIAAGGLRVPRLFAPSAPPSATAALAPGGGLVAVLQQEPSSPAFLLTIDPARRTLIVRRVSAREQAGHSYELWLIAPRSQKPVSLGLVGGGEFTQRPLPAGFDLDTMRTAAYAISFEPAGGSKSGAPSGPILFTGRLVESIPPPASAAPKT